MKKLTEIAAVFGCGVLYKRIVRCVVTGILLFPLAALAQKPPNIILENSCPGGWVKPNYPEPVLVNCYDDRPYHGYWTCNPGEPVITPGTAKPPVVLPGAIPMNLCDLPTGQSATLEYTKKDGINASIKITKYFFTGTIGVNTEESVSAKFKMYVPPCSFYRLHVEEVETTNTVSITVEIVRRTFWKRWNPFSPCSDLPRSVMTDQPCGTYTPPPVTRSTYEYAPKYKNVGCPNKPCPPCPKGPPPPPECPCPE